MTVDLDDLHPRLLAAYQEQALTEISQGDNPVIRVGNTVGCMGNFLTFVLGFGLCILLPDLWFIGFLVIILSIFIHPLIKARTVRKLGRKVLRRPQTMRVVLPKAAKTETEQAYVHNVTALLSLDKTEGIDAHEIMRAMNLLMDDDYSLEAQSKKAVDALGKNTERDLKDEIRGLQTDIAATHDEIILESLRRSLTICEAQLPDVAAIERAAHRLSSQRHVISKGLSSIGTTIGRMQVATLPLDTPNIAQITDTVTEINHQTRSVEEAVQELIDYNGRVIGQAESQDSRNTDYDY